MSKGEHVGRLSTPDTCVSAVGEIHLCDSSLAVLT